ncbi:MAG: hypothetical protein IJ092_13200 [Atopobiaceae bacterium]|nr:hypothetical protein [Atopobiaceae bacterium]MBR1828436.1 hypothetical protein [Atopobiaceae bacterium]
MLEDILLRGGVCLLLVSFVLAVCAVRDFVRLDIRGALDDLSGKRRARGIEEMATHSAGGLRRPKELVAAHPPDRSPRAQLPYEVVDDAQETLLDELDSLTYVLPNHR